MLTQTCQKGGIIRWCDLRLFCTNVGLGAWLVSGCGEMRSCACRGMCQSWLGGRLVHAAIAWRCKHGNHVGRKEAHTCMSKCTNQCQSDLLITKYTNSWFIVSRSAMHVQPMINIQQVGMEMLYSIYNCCAHEWACQSLVLDHNKWPMSWD